MALKTNAEPAMVGKIDNSTEETLLQELLAGNYYGDNPQFVDTKLTPDCEQEKFTIVCHVAVIHASEYDTDTVFTIPAKHLYEYTSLNGSAISPKGTWKALIADFILNWLAKPNPDWVVVKRNTSHDEYNDIWYDAFAIRESANSKYVFSYAVKVIPEKYFS